MDINSLIGTLLSSDSVSGVSKATKANDKDVQNVLNAALPMLPKGAKSQSEDKSTAESFASALLSALAPQLGHRAKDQTDKHAKHHRLVPREQSRRDARKAQKAGRAAQPDEQNQLPMLSYPLDRRGKHLEHRGIYPKSVAQRSPAYPGQNGTDPHDQSLQHPKKPPQCLMPSLFLHTCSSLLHFEFAASAAASSLFQYAVSDSDVTYICDAITTGTFVFSIRVKVSSP